MASEHYIAYNIRSKDEILLALLSMYAFDSFEERESHTIGYISESNHATEQENIVKLLEQSKVVYDFQRVENRNWNAEWEASFAPVKVEDFCSVRADFHPRDTEVKYDIVINPKLAFGTGHHETTYMMINAMRHLPLEGAEVLDYGCGTGILAILAGLMNASSIKAIDIEEESYLNTIENAQVNLIENIESIHGTLEDVSHMESYDIILANINRNVLINNAQKLVKMVRQKGSLILSGILVDDQDLIKNKYSSLGLSLVQDWSRGEWKCFHYKWLH